jgi:preprotein translocase subunit SecD
VRTLIGQTGHLSFVLLPPETYGTSIAQGLKQVPTTGETIDPSLPAQFTGADLDPSLVYLRDDTVTGGSLVDFGFKEPAASAFETWSAQHVNDFFAIVLDGKVLSVPYVKSTIVGGRGEISGAFTAQSAAELATILQAGWLPYPLSEVSETGPIGSPAVGSGVPVPSGAPMESGGAIHSGAPMESGVPLQSGAPSAVASPSAAASPQL